MTIKRREAFIDCMERLRRIAYDVGDILAEEDEELCNLPDDEQESAHYYNLQENVSIIERVTRLIEDALDEARELL